MDNEERKIKFTEITEKYNTEESEDFEKEEHIFRIVQKFAISNLMLCMLLVGIGIIFSLDCFMFIALILALIGFILLIINLIRDYIHSNKTKKKWNKYTNEIDNLFKKQDTKNEKI